MSERNATSGEMGDQAFREDLPFYVNGTLNEERRRACDQYLEAHPEARPGLLFLQAAQQSMAREYERMDPLAGYDVFKQELASRQAAGRGSVAPPLSWWAGIAQRFQGWGMSPAVALLIALVGAQLMVSLTGMAGRDGNAATGSSMRSARTVARQAELRIILKPGAPFDAVLALLMENRCSIIWGPSQLGELWLVAEPQGAAGVVAQRLAASPLVENVQMLESVK